MKSVLAVAIAVACSGLFSGATDAQSTLPHANGYTLTDGAIRIVGAASMEKITATLNALFVKKHPGTSFKYEGADDNGAISALIFDATPFAPLSSVYGGGIAYSDIVKAAPFSIRIAHASLSPNANISPLVVIVNPANPLDNMPYSNLASLFSKPMRAKVFSKWSQAGVTGQSGEMSILPAGLPWSDH
jgi:ABC-type phosphate transport system substrate-binding protein